MANGAGLLLLGGIWRLDLLRSQVCKFELRPEWQPFDRRLKLGYNAPTTGLGVGKPYSVSVAAYAPEETRHERPMLF